MYVDVPTKVSAIELMSSPETPKSHILISPAELHRIFDGLMSNETMIRGVNQCYSSITDETTQRNVREKTELRTHLDE